MVHARVTSRDCDRISDGLEAILQTSARSRNNIKRFFNGALKYPLSEEELDLEPEHDFEMEERLQAGVVEEINSFYEDMEPEPEPEPDLSVCGSPKCTLCAADRKAEIDGPVFLLNGVSAFVESVLD